MSSEEKIIEEEKKNVDETKSTEQSTNDTTENETIDGCEKLKREIAEANDKYVRLYAEFDNYRRRTRQEHANLLLTASEKVLTSLLPIVDDFLRAFENNEDKKSFEDGVKIINDKLWSVLKNNGVTKIETKCGDDFDDNLHEAIVKQKTDKEEMKGKIIGIIENGYKMHDKVLRYVKVIIGD